MQTISSFKSTFEKAAYGHDYNKVFDDFLSMLICAFTQNIHTGLSHYEDEYLKIIEPYKANDRIKHFGELLGELVLYMEVNYRSAQGNDLLGEFFQQEITRGRNGQFFTPFPVCLMMARMTKSEESKSLNVLDPCCGSGRLLVAFGMESALRHRYYGIDIDGLCVKMTAVNLFLNGLWGEVVCADALAANDFRFGYRVSFFPLGIFKIENKEESVIWQSHEVAFSENKKPEQLTLF